MGAVIRTRVVVVNDGDTSGIGVECYQPRLNEPSTVYYIASIYVDRFVLEADGLLIAAEQIRRDYGRDCELYIKTPHVAGAFQAGRRAVNAKIRADRRRMHIYEDARTLAEDAIRRKTTISEKLEGEIDNMERSTGTVKFFNGEKGWGFINSDNGESVFIHFSNIIRINNEFRTLYPEDRVIFDIEQTDRGLQAINLSYIDQHPSEAVTEAVENE